MTDPETSSSPSNAILRGSRWQRVAGLACLSTASVLFVWSMPAAYPLITVAAAMVIVVIGVVGHQRGWLGTVEMTLAIVLPGLLTLVFFAWLFWQLGQGLQNFD